MAHELRALREALDDEGIEALAARRSPFLERFALVTAVIMRRLSEVDALTEEVESSTWPVLEYPCTAPPPHRAWFTISEDGKTWRQPIESHYALNQPTSSRLRFRDVCNYLLHHFAFDVVYDPEHGVASLRFNSDRTKDRLFSLELPDYLVLVDEVARDYVTWVDMDRGAGRVVRRRSRPAGW